MVRPVKVQVAVVLGHKKPPGLETTSYAVIGEPLSVPNDDHETVMLRSPRETIKLVGAKGGPAGVTAADGLDGSERLIELIATTENVYAVPLVKPETTQVLPTVVQVNASGFEVTS